MCGYLGKISLRNIDTDYINSSNKRIICRGPDSLKSLNFKIGEYSSHFIFNRLSILDLDKRADQPLESADKSSSIMFNGEIYNHSVLRDMLVKNGKKFKTKNSDTEVILNGLDHFGVKFINQLRGQFSIAYLNKITKKLYLIRDRVGQKPLFYSHDSSSIALGSNLISTAEISGNINIDKESLNEYLECGVVQSPKTIFKNIWKLCPGEIIEYDLSESEIKLNKSFYWDPIDFVDDKKFKKEEFFSIFSDSVDMRTKADVEVANFLSGGIDSTAIAKNLHDNNIAINSFSVGLLDSDYDESKWSKKVSETYRTNHKQVDVNLDISLDQILSILSQLDEPYSDPSVIPSYILAKQISNDFKVAISGDGGDELLGGYLRISKSLTKKNTFENIVSNFYKIYPAFLGTGSKLLGKSADLGESYTAYLFDEKFMKILREKSTKRDFVDKVNSYDLNDYKKLLYSEFKFFLTEMMLLKVDRTSMANSLEVRSPFVDHKLIEYIYSHENSYHNINNPKSILKEYLSSDFNEDFLQRKKMGFIFDVEKFIYSNINHIAELIESGYIRKHYEVDFIKLLLLNKSRMNANRIWRVLVLETFINQLQTQNH
jgi:asparagine synthase (glutamine-hydrolysing)